MQVTSLLLAPALALAAAAPAVAQWQPPATASPQLAEVGEPVLSYAGTDSGVLWARERSGPADARGAVTIVPDGRQRVVKTADGPPVRFGEAGVIYPRSFRVRGGRTEVGVSIGTLESFGSFQSVGTARYLVEGPVVAANARGDALVAWIEGTRDGTRLRIALRRQDAPHFERTKTIRGSGEQSGLSVAVGARRHLAVAYQQVVERTGRRRVEVRRGGVRGGPGALQAVGGSLGQVRSQVVVAPNGRTTVAYETQDRGEEADLVPRVLAAVRPAGARRFRTAQQLAVGRAPARAPGVFRLAADPSGRATVAFATVRGERHPYRFPVLVATQDARGVFGQAQVVAADGIPLGVGVSRSGETAVAWASRRAPEILARLRPSGGAFGPRELVAAEGAPRLGDVAYTGSSQKPAVAWSTGRELRFARRG